MANKTSAPSCLLWPNPISDLTFCQLGHGGKRENHLQEARQGNVCDPEPGLPLWHRDAGRRRGHLSRLRQLARQAVSLDRPFSRNMTSRWRFNAMHCFLRSSWCNSCLAGQTRCCHRLTSLPLDLRRMEPSPVQKAPWPL